ncbi:hypothetical protein [Novipirellula rosea]|uniref:hypothetical protein n=1 Tax=Novipirellula rosea TaxID=1031540 RepID=UPI0031EDA522
MAIWFFPPSVGQNHLWPELGVTRYWQYGVTEFGLTEPASALCWFSISKVIKETVLIRRSVPAKWLDSPPSFLRSFIADPELFPEIRDNSITVYYKSRALIRELTLRDGEVSGSISLDYIPQARTQSRYASVILGEAGFEYSPSVTPLQPGNLDPVTLKHFKARMDGRGDEGDVIHRLTIRPTNLIVDQEVAFQDPGVRGFDKIDLCVFDPVVSAFSFVEVKTIVDGRLFLPSKGDVPEVIQQLQRYKDRIEQNSSELITVFEKVVQIKRDLGMETRLAEIPEAVPRAIVSRPALVIGNCSKIQVQEILAGAGSWKPLMDVLPSVASGLVLCGGAGANLNLDPAGSQTFVFDSGITN